MRRFIAGLCCVIVGLQVLIGVPLVVGLACFLYVAQDLSGPVTFEARVASNSEPETPVAVNQQPEPAASDEAVLEAREGRGSLLAGTMLGENLSPADERQEFVAAFRQLAAQMPSQEIAPAITTEYSRAPSLELAPASESISPPTAGLPTYDQSPVTGCDSLRAEADHFAISQLYAMAERDERTELYDRADQWRGLARAIRRESQSAVSAPSARVGECLRCAEDSPQFPPAGSTAN